MFCELFGYSKQAYYKAAAFSALHKESHRQAKSLVLKVRGQMPRLGTRKLYHLLHREIGIGRDKLFDLLREESLLVCRKKRYSVTTCSKHWMRKYPNLIKDMEISRPEQVWVADITYISTLEGNAYLHLVTDAYSKQIMGYELCDNMESASTLKALQMAVKGRVYRDSALIHHSDRGLQYCSSLYTSYLKENTILISMTEQSDPYENAVAERVNGILKDEFGLSEKLNTLTEAITQARESIRLYNNSRPHWSCSLLTPVQMHAQSKVKLTSYKKKVHESQSRNP
jgi:transposase InsO family protein